MDLELATITDIINELSKRGLQFLIVIEKTKVNDGTGELEIACDAKKDLPELVELLAPYFGIEVPRSEDGY